MVMVRDAGRAPEYRRIAERRRLGRTESHAVGKSVRKRGPVAMCLAPALGELSSSDIILCDEGSVNGIDLTSSFASR